jgi:hypothetical protein
MDKVISDVAPAAAIILVAVGLVGYALALLLATFFSGKPASLGARLAGWFTGAPAQNLGIPCAAISAFAITAVLLRAFVPATDPGSPLNLKAFGLEFSGPSGPITLWLMCFLGFVLAIKLLRA